jgi:hypothetical protein
VSATHVQIPFFISSSMLDLKRLQQPFIHHALRGQAISILRVGRDK